MVSLITLISTMCFSQEYKKIFLGDDFNTYKGLYLKINELNYSTTSYKFYTEAPTKPFQEAKLYKPIGKYSSNTDTNFLSGRIFIVSDIILSTLPNDFDPQRHPIFQLKDITNNEILYYVYDTQYDWYFPFLVKGFEYNAKYLTRNLLKTYDDFTNDTTIYTPKNGGLVLFKISNKKTKYYIRLSCSADTYTSGNEIIILFDNGQRITKPAATVDIKSAVISIGIVYTASSFFEITLEELLLLQKNKITKFRLYVHDRTLTDDENELIKLYSQSITL